MAGENKTNTICQSYSIILYICQRRVVLHFQVQGQPPLYNKNLGVFHKVLQDKTAPKGQSIVGSVKCVGNDSGISLLKNGTSIFNAQVSNMCWRLVQVITNYLHNNVASVKIRTQNAESDVTSCGCRHRHQFFHAAKGIIEKRRRWRHISTINGLWCPNAFKCVLLRSVGLITGTKNEHQQHQHKQ